MTRVGEMTAKWAIRLDVVNWYVGKMTGYHVLAASKQPDQWLTRPHLQGTDGSTLETQISLEVLCDLTHQALEGQLADQQLSGLLVTTNFSQSHSTRTVTMGLLHATGGRGTLTGSLGGQLLPGSFTSSGFTGSLLCTSHGSYDSPVGTQYCQ